MPNPLETRGESHDLQSRIGQGVASAALPAVPLIVGIGTSAGGPKAFETLFSALRAETGMSFVLVQPRDTQADSQLTESIADCPAMTIHVAECVVEVQPNTVYVIPPDALLTIQGSTLQVARPAITHARCPTFLPLSPASLNREQADTLPSDLDKLLHTTQERLHAATSEIEALTQELQSCKEALQAATVERNSAQRLSKVDHEVKNVLAIVSALISQTLMVGLKPEEFAVEIEGRIQAVAKAHGLLTHAGRGTMSLRDVILTELAPYNCDANHLAIACIDVDLSPKAGLAIALAIHELASNAAKYGALSTPAGHLSVAADLSSSPAGPVLTLAWTEAYGPPVAPPARRGFGTSLIERALAYELDAEVTRRFDPTGVVCVAAIPLTDEVGHARPNPG